MQLLVIIHDVTSGLPFLLFLHCWAIDSNVKTFRFELPSMTNSTVYPNKRNSMKIKLNKDLCVCVVCKTVARVVLKIQVSEKR